MRTRIWAPPRRRDLDVATSRWQAPLTILLEPLVSRQLLANTSGATPSQESWLVCGSMTAKSLQTGQPFKTQNDGILITREYI